MQRRKRQVRYVINVHLLSPLVSQTKTASAKEEILVDFRYICLPAWLLGSVLSRCMVFPYGTEY